MGVSATAEVTDARLREASLWQRVLAAEISPGRLSYVLSEPTEAGIRAALTPDERKRFDDASVEALSAALTHGVSAVHGDALPEGVREAGSPPAFFLAGDRAAIDAPCVGIVGTRGASTYGKACAMKFAEALARAGVTVVSGGALGIDVAAHRGALDAGGRTVAVLANGVDQVYPAVHRGLFAQIRQRGGALVSQFPLGAKPQPYRFLARNHLIAALSQAVIIIEAPAESGALRTALAAAELGREVFVVPANIDATSFRGSFGLLRDGAALVWHPAQVLESLGVEPPPPPTDSANPTGLAARILAVLTTDPMPIERIVDALGEPTSKILSEITLLELEGALLHDAGGYARKP